MGQIAFPARCGDLAIKNKKATAEKGLPSSAWGTSGRHVGACTLQNTQNRLEASYLSQSPTFHHAGGLCLPRGYQSETSDPHTAWLGSPSWLDCWKSQRYGHVPLVLHRLSGGKKVMYAGNSDAG